MEIDNRHFKKLYFTFDPGLNFDGVVLDIYYEWQIPVTRGGFEHQTSNIQRIT